jgi:hypothetical protein
MPDYYEAILWDLSDSEIEAIAIEGSLDTIRRMLNGLAPDYRAPVAFKDLEAALGNYGLLVVLALEGAPAGLVLIRPALHPTWDPAGRG